MLDRTRAAHPTANNIDYESGKLIGKWLELHSRHDLLLQQDLEQVSIAWIH
jgi:hypothetical protein